MEEENAVEERRNGSFIIDPLRTSPPPFPTPSRSHRLPLSPLSLPVHPTSSTYGDEWPCKKHDKTREARYKFLHRANYGIRKEGRIRSVTFHPLVLLRPILTRARTLKTYVCTYVRDGRVNVQTDRQTDRHTRVKRARGTG